MKLCIYQQYYFSRVPSLPNCFHEDKYFNTSRTDKALKKHYIISNKTSMNIGKSMREKQFCNHQ